MRALQVVNTDGPRAMTLTDVAVPRPGSGEVLIEVLAAAVNLADVSNRQLLWDHQVQLIGLDMRAMMMHRPDLLQQAGGELSALLSAHGIQTERPTVATLADGLELLTWTEDGRTTGKLALAPEGTPR